jgi:hypothetical protein
MLENPKSQKDCTVSQTAFFVKNLLSPCQNPLGELCTWAHFHEQMNLDSSGGCFVFCVSDHQTPNIEYQIKNTRISEPLYRFFTKPSILSGHIFQRSMLHVGA